MGDLVVRTEACHLFAREVGHIIGDDGVRNPKAAYNIFSEELDNFLPRDFGE